MSSYSPKSHVYRIVEQSEQQAGDDDRINHRTKLHHTPETAHFIPPSLERHVKESDQRIDCDDVKFHPNTPHDDQHFAYHFIPSSVERLVRSRRSNDTRFHVSIMQESEEAESCSIPSARGRLAQTSIPRRTNYDDVKPHQNAHQDEESFSNHFTPFSAERPIQQSERSSNVAKYNFIPLSDERCLKQSELIRIANHSIDRDSQPAVHEYQRNKDITIRQGVFSSLTSRSSIQRGVTGPEDQVCREPPPPMLASCSAFKQKNSQAISQETSSSLKAPVPLQSSLFSNERELQRITSAKQHALLNQEVPKFIPYKPETEREYSNRSVNMKVFERKSARLENQPYHISRSSSKAEEVECEDQRTCRLLKGGNQPSEDVVTHQGMKKTQHEGLKGPEDQVCREAPPPMLVPYNTLKKTSSQLINRKTSSSLRPPELPGPSLFSNERELQSNSSEQRHALSNQTPYKAETDREYRNRSENMKIFEKKQARPENQSHHICTSSSKVKEFGCEDQRACRLLKGGNQASAEVVTYQGMKKTQHEGLKGPEDQVCREAPTPMLVPYNTLKKTSSRLINRKTFSSLRPPELPGPSLFSNERELQSNSSEQSHALSNQTPYKAETDREYRNRSENTKVFEKKQARPENQSHHICTSSSKVKEIECEDQRAHRMRKGANQPSEEDDMQQTMKNTQHGNETPQKELHVRLSFKMCFEEDTTVEDIITTAFQNAGGENYEIIFQETSLLPKKNETICEFVITNNNNIFKTEMYLKRVIKKLSQVFDTHISVLDIEIMAYTPDISQHKGRDLEDENIIVVNSVKKGNYSSSSQKDMDEMQRDELAASIPISLVLSVKKYFDSPKAFAKFIRTAEMALPFKFDIVNGSITISSDSSQCLLKTKTMEDAHDVKKVFHNLMLETKLKISCYLLEVERDVAKAQNTLKLKIEESLPAVKRRGEEVLHSHQRKIDNILVKLQEIESEYQEFDRMSDRHLNMEKEKTLGDKLEELEMQKTEFCRRFDAIVKDLKGMIPTTDQASKLNRLKRSIGIECNRLRNALPIYARRREIIQHVKLNQVSIILGETGSGKSTQMAQYFYDAGLSIHGSIVCTQPRRVAASTLAERVATEMSERVGDLVGYKIGSMKKSNENTKIFFTTDSALLNECLEDPELRKYSCIIVDEAHERSIYTDILLGMIKVCLKKRPKLRLVITSATINPEVFIRYFKTGPELRVSGRNFPVDVLYSEDASDDFENFEVKAVSKALEIHRNEGPGDILVFLCSPVEIMRCCEELEKKMSDRNDFKCLPLHGQLPPDEQKKVFEKLQDGQRKIVFSTNCAETSITIDGIKYVVDTGVAKEMRYDPRRNISQLGIFVISKSSADQRKGRAGRTASGKCYRLYSKEGFDTMDSINEPEILRVHLGQAALKLAELGVDIESYDFVQAPSETALQSALNTLQYLGAIVDHRITLAGKWIARLPFDPKLGYIIFKSEELNLLYESIVFAAVVSTGSDLFYRGFSESEAQVVARSKSYFASEYGDPFTWLNIYKAWTGVEKKDKSSWCRDHCINYKTISYAHQNIQEVMKILLKDLKIPMTQEFSNDSSAMNQLRKLIFEANAMSLCNFSGFARAGYFSLASERQVYVHPSSILKALDLRPEWIVYSDLVKTSKEFIKGITTVEEQWVHELIACGRICLDLKKAKQQKCSCVYHDEVGPSVFRAIVGPRFSHIQVLEEDMLNSMPGSVLTASRDLYTIDIHSSHPMSPYVCEVFRNIKSSDTDKLMSEESEFKLGKAETLGKSSVRVKLGNGGCVKAIFMPDQSDKVLIKRSHVYSSEEDIERKFKAFGEIKDIVQFKSDYTWGYVQYSSVTEAMCAVEATGNDEVNAGVLKLDTQFNKGKNIFESKVTWLRRPVKGKGTAFIKCDPLDKPSLVGRTIRLSTGYCTLKPSRKNDDDLIIFDTGPVTEEEIKDVIINSLCDQGIRNVNIKVTMDREKVPVSPGLVHDRTRLISNFINQHVDEKSFTVKMLSPKPASFHYVAFISFIDSVKGYSICQKMKQELFLDGQRVTVNPCLRTVMHVPHKIRSACQENFDKVFAHVAAYKGTTVTWKKSNIEIKCPEPEIMVTVRGLLSKEIEGEVIDKSYHDFSGCLLNRAGQERLSQIEKYTSCLIITDFQKEKIHVYGCDTNVENALREIKLYLNEIQNSHQGLYELKGQSKPPGLAKLSMNTYGPNLETLVEECDLKLVKINWKTLCVNLVGGDVSIQKAQQKLSDLEERAWRKAGLTRNSYLPECSVCMCEIEEKTSLYRMEVCGHAYCMDCLKHQVSFSVNNKEFPLTCASGDCKSLFVMKDLKFALRKEWVEEDKVTRMAVNAFVMANREKYKFCSTPNCPVVYESTSEETGHEFTCPLCLTSICTSCHNAFHQGLSCNMAKDSSRADAETLAWLQENPEKRKRCPGCKWPIEKIEGCNKMHCINCNTYFCWVCLHISASEQACYAHLQTVHGSFV